MKRKIIVLSIFVITLVYLFTFLTLEIMKIQIIHHKLLMQVNKKIESNILLNKN